MAVTYEFCYFDFHGLAIIPRMLLSLGEFNWTNKFPEDWKAEKPTTPLTHLPVLTEIQEDGSKFVLAEAQAIYRYLGRKMDIMGKTDHEMALVDQFCFSWEELHEKYWPLLYEWKKLLTTEQFDETLRKVLHEQIKPIVRKHEEALARNGTGFYVGDKMTLADIHATISVPFLNHDDLFTKELFPNLFALHEKLMDNEAIRKEFHRYPINPRG
ncbi:hypothetical protein NQZ79_g2703 [Umbelopsis isabellina]|nr:hypothetical protein NQZ79_g2703 [Umbelopsis isabellina]